MMPPKGVTPSLQHSWSSLEDSSTTVLHESVEGVPVEEKKIEQHFAVESSEEFNDVFSVLVREGSSGVALYAVLMMSVMMSFVSFMIMFQYEPPLEQEGDSDVNLWNDVCTPQRHNTVWADLLSEQIEILQNLIHASLLGGAVLVAAYRGDVVWLFFVRNCLFYFCLAAVSFLIVDTVSRDVMSIRWLISLLFCLIGTVGFVKLEGTCQSLRKLQKRLFELSRTPSSSMKENAARDIRVLPNFQVQTCSQQAKANLIYQCAVVVQIMSLVYVACTTILAVFPLKCEEANPHRGVEGIVPVTHVMSSTSLSPFQMGYSLGAHEAFLLALIMLASTFPLCPASVGGALLSSLWRLLIACCSLISLLSTSDIMDLRMGMSLFFTLSEAISMAPILIASWQLTVEAGTFRTILGRADQHTTAHKSPAGYTPVTAIEMDDDEDPCHEMEIGCSNHSDPTTDSIFHHQMTIPTLRLIASSSRFSARQRFGARTMWFSSFCLLLEMTAENMMLLITSPIGAHSTHEIYKWGMHLVSMYAFCVIMNVSTTDVYAKTRTLLCLACPAGSFIGLWQLCVLVNNTPDLIDDPSALLVACLFIFRALSGIGQCIGLFALDTIEPETGTLVQMNVATNDCVLDKDTALRNAISRGRFALFKLFLPAFVAYTVTSAMLSSCSEPMISPTVPASCGGMNMFMLVPNWPGLGLFFHFGGLLTIFASDGLALGSPSYPPSVLIGALLALHASILIATHFVMELTHPHVFDYIESFERQDWLRRITLFGWMVSSFYLYLCLQHVAKLKQPVNF